MDRQTLGVMLDCSRNAVMRPEKVKEFAALIRDMGYNMLQLYTEDTYEIEGEPYFGHMRGRYTMKELQDIDAYCNSIGIELVPCIQVLAHMNQLTQWETYGSYFDCNDIMLVGDEKVYALIDKMFETISKCFTSRRVNVGMDEAHFLGRGRYQDIHGYRDKGRILKEHLEKVHAIAKKYGFSMMMWSDMPIRLYNNGEYFRTDLEIPKEATEIVPDDVEMIYWDYFGKDVDYYESILDAHYKFGNPIGFASGGWTWMTFAPNSEFGYDTNEAAMKCLSNHPDIKTRIVTMWGDGGKDCSYFSALPVLFATAQMNQGNFDRADIERKFEERYGYTFREFMDLELPNITKEEPSHYHNPSKYLLYSDPFIGVYDFTVAGDIAERYGKARKKLAQSINGRAYDSLFDLEVKLLDVLIYKADLGVRLRRAYQDGDKESLVQILQVDFEKILEALPKFIEAFRRVWFDENKPFGLEVQELRLGGLVYRIQCCKERLAAYLSGEVDCIAELEEQSLEKFKGFQGEAVAQNHWQSAYTTSLM